MTDLVLIRSNPVGRLRDFAALGKPRLSALVIFTTATGLWLAPEGIGLAPSLAFLLATSALVAAANSLNCWIEREIDGLMIRTRERPLPAGRLEPRTAMLFGAGLGVASLAVISVTTNPLTTGLGALALFSYVAVYTPLKRVSPWAVVVGALPGALPPLMGWTAATGTIEPPGLFLFGILFLWQLPHFLAISLYLKDDFRRGGIRVLPLVHGDHAARVVVVATTALLVAFSVGSSWSGTGGTAYRVTAALLGAAWLALALPGLRSPAPTGWARRIFACSLLYLPILVSALVLDAR